MKLQFTKRFAKEYERLPRPLQGRVDKTLELLLENPRHPSLHIKKSQATKTAGKVVWLFTIILFSPSKTTATSCSALGPTTS